MSDQDRRTVVAAATQPAIVSTPSAASAGWYRYKLGTFDVTIVHDGVNRFKFPDGFVNNKSRDEINAAASALGLQSAPDTLDVPYSPTVINTGAKLVVIDTGTSEANFAASNGATGRFHRNMTASGLDRTAVDTVIITHFHGDHINGLIDLEGKLAFPNAEVLVPAPEWAYFMDDAEMNRQTTERMKGVFANARRVFDALGRKVTPYQPGKEIVSGITSMPTYGHTPGQCSMVVASGNARMIVQADVTNVPLFVRHPDWHAMFDQDPIMAEATRRTFYDMAVAEKMLIQGFHYPFPTLATIEKTATGYRENLLPMTAGL